MNQEPQRRYPGLNYFKETQRAQFFGRDDEIEELHALISTEKIVALFGKSGYGKSSLLRAGILPKLDPAVTPVLVQLGAYQPGQSLTPVATTLHCLSLAINRPALTFLYDNPESTFIEQISDGSSLWSRFKRKQSATHNRFLLVFDQFEEFDSYPATQKNEFKQQLAELLFTRIPQAVRDRSDTLTDEQQALLAKPLDVKAVFAIREDRLSVLDGLADKLPAILHKRFKLQGLSRPQAMRAVEGPAALGPTPDARGAVESTVSGAPLPFGGGAGGGVTPFLSPSFTYTPETLQAILAGLEKKTVANTGFASEKSARIEAFLLQICCENIETSVIALHRAGQKDIVVKPSDLPPFERLFEEYYRGKIAALPTETDRVAASRMIEDELVKADPATGIAYRMSADGRRLRALPGMNEDLLKRLTDDFLLRSEPNTTGDFNYEVSHDTLVEGILKSKTEYEAAEEERKRKEALAAEEARIAVEKAEAQRRARRALITSLVAGALVLAAAVAAVFAFQQYRKATAAIELAQQKTDEAKESKSEAEQKTRAADEADKRSRRNEEIAALEQKKAKTEQENARLMQLKAERAAEQAVFALLDATRKDFFQLRYDDAFVKMKNAAELGAVKDSVALELMEIAFFHYYTGRQRLARESFNIAARLLGKPAISEKTDFEAALHRLDAGRDSALYARYFPAMLGLEGGSYKIQDKYEVSVAGFKMAKTETTVWQYNLFCEANGRNITQRTGPDGKAVQDDKYQPGWGWIGDHPVVYVSWYDAVEYANWASLKRHLTPAYDIRPAEKDTLNNQNDGDDFRWTVVPVENARGYRLPSEVEWEFAARGGARRDAFDYSGSSDIEEVAWYYGNSGSHTHTVATKNANGAGLFDMSGNVWEWCWDWYGEADYFETLRDAPEKDPRGPKSGSSRVLRGGSWDCSNNFCSVSRRYSDDPRIRYDDFGFRLAQDK